MRKFFLRVIYMAAAVYLGLCALLFIFQRDLIYFPQPRANTTGITVLTIENGAERALVSSRPHEGDDAVLYFGGNAEDVSLDMPEYAAAFPNSAIYLLHYRGYGGSSGNPTEKGIVSDALALFDFVHAQHKNVVVIGRSLGTGVAVQVASQRPVVRLVLVTPYDSFKDIAVKHYPYLPVGLLLQDKFESGLYAPRITAPTLIIAAGNDEVIPRSSTEHLQTRFQPGVAHSVVIPGAGHNTVSNSPNYLTLLKSG